MRLFHYLTINHKNTLILSASPPTSIASTSVDSEIKIAKRKTIWEKSSKDIQAGDEAYSRHPRTNARSARSGMIKSGNIKPITIMAG